MKEVEEIDKCPITNDSEFHTYFDLGDFPLVNNLSKTREESINCKRFPLKVNFFEKSKLGNNLPYPIEETISYYNI
jgi:hypothetical protein